MYLISLLALSLFVQVPAPSTPHDAQVPGSKAVGSDDPATGAPEEDADLSAALLDVLKGQGVPGASAAIVRFGEPARIGVFGLRKAGSDVPVSPADQFHIGSDTKAMNAVLIGRLVDADVLAWDTTIKDALPRLSRSIHKKFRDVTITQLLRHTSGVPANAERWRAFPGKPLGERRRRLITANLKSPPVHEPGSAYLYSNLGHMIASTMAEAKTGKSWEELMRQQVFEPLGMASAGFGPPGAKGKLDQPWGHSADADGELVPVQADNDPAMGGAGIVHLSMEDWGKFVMQFSKQAAEESEFLTPASRRKLLEVGRNGYAFGWAVGRRPWAGGTVLNHAGSNTMWYAVAWIAPEQNRGFLIAANAATPSVGGLIDGVVGKLLALDAARLAEVAGQKR